MQAVPKGDGKGDRHDHSRNGRRRSGTLAEAVSGGGAETNPAITYPCAQDAKQELLSKYCERIVSELEILDDIYRLWPGGRVRHIGGTPMRDSI